MSLQGDSIAGAAEAVEKRRSDLRAGQPIDLGLAIGAEYRLALGIDLGHAELDHAHAAVAGDGELGMVAVMGNELGRAAGDFDGVETLGELHPDAVNLHVEHGGVGGSNIVVEGIHARSGFGVMGK